MQMRLFTRLTLGFSRKIENHRAVIALHVAWYNVCRVHETLRCTPAMALGVTDHIWTVGELVQAALDAPVPPPLPTPGQQPLGGMSAGRAKGTWGGDRTGVTGRPIRGNPGPKRFRVIKGGRR